MEDVTDKMAAGMMYYTGTGTGDALRMQWDGEVARRWRQQYIHENPYPAYVFPWVDPPIIKKEMNKKLLLL